MCSHLVKYCSNQLEQEMVSPLALNRHFFALFDYNRGQQTSNSASKDGGFLLKYIQMLFVQSPDLQVVSEEHRLPEAYL